MILLRYLGVKIIQTESRTVAAGGGGGGNGGCLTGTGFRLWTDGGDGGTTR